MIVPSIGAMTLGTWTGSVTVCVQRGTSSFMSSPSDCGNGYQRCGKDEVLFCVKEGERCPISELLVSEKTQYGYESQPFSNGMKIYFKRNTTSFPLAGKFRLSHSEWSQMTNKRLQIN